MNRQQKEQEISFIKKSFSKCSASFLVGYSGLSVDHLQQLRTKLRACDSSFKITKMRLAKRAVQDIDDMQEMVGHFKDQLGIIFSGKDFSCTAKILFDFSKANESLELVVGYLDKTVLDKTAIARIASLPSKEVLLGQVCRGLQAPISGTVLLLNMLILRLLWVLKQASEKGE